ISSASRSTYHGIAPFSLGKRPSAWYTMKIARFWGFCERRLRYTWQQLAEFDFVELAGPGAGAGQGRLVAPRTAVRPPGVRVVPAARAAGQRRGRRGAGGVSRRG